MKSINFSQKKTPQDVTYNPKSNLNKNIKIAIIILLFSIALAAIISFSMATLLSGFSATGSYLISKFNTFKNWNIYAKISLIVGITLGTFVIVGTSTAAISFFILAGLGILYLQIKKSPTSENKLELEEIRNKIFNSPEITQQDIQQDEKMKKKWGKQLIAGNGNPTYTKILSSSYSGNLYLGRAGDTVNTFFDLIISATKPDNVNKNLINAFKECFDGNDLPNKEIYFLQGENSKDDDVGGKSFLKGFRDHKDMEKTPLYIAVQKMRRALKSNKAVFVCCQQGKDRSAVVLIAYLMMKFEVSMPKALNFVRQERPIVSDFKTISKYRRVLEVWEKYISNQILPSLDDPNNNDIL